MNCLTDSKVSVSMGSRLMSRIEVAEQLQLVGKVRFRLALPLSDVVHSHSVTRLS